MLSLTRVAAVLSALAGTGVLALACGTDAIGVDACRQIESARCLQAPNCGIDMSVPAHRGAPTTDIDACVRFYNDACLHGLATTTAPGNVQVKACVDAINTGDCLTVKHPEDNAACAWLVPPATVVADASTEAEAAVTSDATTVATFACPGGCADNGTVLPICLGVHTCACAAAIAGGPPTNCSLAGSDANGAIDYCCQ